MTKQTCFNFLYKRGSFWEEPGRGTLDADFRVEWKNNRVFAVAEWSY